MQGKVIVPEVKWGNFKHCMHGYIAIYIPVCGQIKGKNREYMVVKPQRIGV